MNELPAISGIELIKIFTKIDYEVDHQTGSHFILRQPKEPYRRLTIPNHKVIAKGTLRAIIREAGLTKEEFLKLIK